MTAAKRAQLVRKLEQLAKIANELDAEAKKLYGPEGFLFYEAGGAFHLMDGDSDEGMGERTEHIQASSESYCRMGCGAW